MSAYPINAEQRARLEGRAGAATSPGLDEDIAEVINNEYEKIRLTTEKVERAFYEYFDSSGVDLPAAVPGGKRLRQTAFTGAWLYIRRKLWPPVFFRSPGCTSCPLDYDDLQLLYAIAYKYAELCATYNAVPSVYGYSLLTGIPEETLLAWERGRRSDYVVKVSAPPGTPESMCEAGEAVQSAKYFYLTARDLVQSVRRGYREFYLSNLSDTTIGQLAIANNDPGVGLMYNKVKADIQVDAWESRRIGSSDLAKISELTGSAALPDRKRGKLEKVLDDL